MKIVLVLLLFYLYSLVYSRKSLQDKAKVKMKEMYTFSKEVKQNEKTNDFELPTVDGIIYYCMC